MRQLQGAMTSTIGVSPLRDVPRSLENCVINKLTPRLEDAFVGVKDGDTVLIGGFGTAGIPEELIDGLIATGATTARTISVYWRLVAARRTSTACR